MYPLESNPTLAQIVTRSAACHPSRLEEALRAEAAEYRAYARLGGVPRRTQDAVLAMASHCALAVRAVELFEGGDREALSSMGLGPLIIAANRAAKLQCLPHHIVVDAAIRAGEERGTKKVEART